MKKTVGILGITLFFVIAALILIPAFMNWSSYKHVITSKIQDYVKLDVAIDGKIKLRLLPTPAFAIQNVHIKSPQNCREGDFLSLESIETHLSLTSLMRGKIDLSSIHLIKPDLKVDMSKNCIYPFQAASKSDTPSDTPPVKLSALHIDEGNVTLYEDNTESFHFKKLSFKASFDDLLGPYSLTGEGKYQGQDIDIDVKVGKFSPRSTPLTLIAHLGDDKFDLSGHADMMSGLPEFRGTFTSQLINEDSLLEEASSFLPAALQHKMNLEGKIHVSRKAVKATDITFDWHKIHGTGHISSTFDKIPVITGQINLQPLLLDNYMNKKKKTASLFRKAYAAEPIDSSLPENIDVNLAILAESITHKNYVFHDNSLTLNLKKGKLSLNKVHLGLPFKGSVNGNLNFSPDWQYKGHIKLDIPNMHPFLAAAQIDPPRGLLKKLSLTSNIEGNRASLSYKKLRAKLDQSSIRADGLLRLSDFGIAAKIYVDKLNLTPYLQLAALNEPPRLILAANKTTNFPPLNIDAKCDHLHINETDLHKCHTNFILENDQLNFSNFSGTWNDMIVEATGKVGDISTAPKIETNAALKGKVKDIGDVKATAHFKGTPQKLITTSSFFIYGASGNFEGSFNPLKLEEEIQGQLKVSHPEAGFLFGDREGMGAFSFETRLVTLNKVMSFTKLSGAIGKHILSGNASIDFKKTRPFVTTNLDLGNIKLSHLPQSKSRLIRVAQKTPDRPFSKEPFNMHFWNAFDGNLTFTAKEFAIEDVPFSNLILKAKLNNGHLKTDQLRAKLFRGNLSGKMGFVLRGIPQLTGSFKLDNMDVKAAQIFFGAGTKLTGLLDAEFVMQGRGASPYALMSNVTGQANLNIDQAVIHGLDLNALRRKLEDFDEAIDLIALLSTIKQGGNTPLYKARGTFNVNRGQATTDNTIISCEGGTGYLRGALILPEKTMDLQAEFKLAGKKEFPSLNARFYGPWASPNTDFDTSMLKTFVLGKSALTLNPPKEIKKKRKKKLLKNLLEEIIPDDTDTHQPQEKFDGKELVGDLLQGLLK